MALLSSSLLLRTHALTLLTFAYYLLTNPSQLLSSTPIWLLGEAMSIRPAAYAPEQLQDTLGGNAGQRISTSNRLSSLITGQGAANVGAESELCALLALALVIYAGMVFLFAGDLSLLPASIPSDGKTAEARSSARYAEELHTLLTAQSRWLTLAGLHVMGSSTVVMWIYLFHSHSSTGQSVLSSNLSGFGLLSNRVTFTAALADMLFWGYLWTVVKDEGREVGKALASRRQVEEDDADD
ncbi:hypothetical protein H2200_009135 [Cladophialophora chaetospira]|uniref:Increased loss of mitochondrial DNA protein 1 n=1 Tax=Cladophialophora chaetospira TaxID=386627 RepID=A0AA39CFB8_9EURO|nr:hypothetical protein H2200_009135 [Cladophialophora chaetospira]